MSYRRFDRSRALDPRRGKSTPMLHVMVRRALWFVCGVTLSVAAAGAHAKDPAGQTARLESSCADRDDCLLSSEPLMLPKPYAVLDDLAKLRFPQTEYDEARNQRDFEC